MNMLSTWRVLFVSHVLDPMNSFRKFVAVYVCMLVVQGGNSASQALHMVRNPVKTKTTDVVTHSRDQPNVGSRSQSPHSPRLFNEVLLSLRMAPFRSDIISVQVPLVLFMREFCIRMMVRRKKLLSNLSEHWGGRLRHGSLCLKCMVPLNMNIW